MSESFTLHPQLAADTVELARWPLSLVLLMDDARFPWIILVPRRAGLRDLHDVAPAEQGAMMAEIARAGALMKSVFRADKINTAALGNQVPQLHIHIIARFTSDPAWPKPIWSVGQRQPMTDAERMQHIAALKPGL